MTIGKKNLIHHHHQPINTKKQSNTNTNTNTNNNNLMKMIHHYESELNCLLTECASIDVVLKSLQSFFFVQPMTTEEQLDKVNEELTIAHDELLSQVRQLYRNVIKLDKSIQSLPSHPSKNIPTVSQHNNIKKTKDKKWNNRNHHHTKITKNNINKRHLAFSSSFALSSSITSNSIK